MLLREVVAGLEYERIQGDLDFKVSSISYNSTEVTKDGLFVAITGLTVDGHSFIPNAIEKGARVIVLEKEVPVPDYVTVLKVKNSRDALALISSNFYHHPTKKLRLIGITGTNGKTSTSYFLKSILEEAQKTTGIIGTIGTIIKDQHIKNKNTTPESLNLQQIFSKMVDAEVDHCVMEVSSHSLSLKRVAYCQFDTGIFTNLTPDHLELHKTMEGYFEAKALLFEMTSDFNIVNVDDPYGQRLVERLKDGPAELITYGIENPATIYATDIHCEANFTTYTLNTPIGTLPLQLNVPGEVNVYNSLAAAACAYSEGIPLETIKRGIEAITNIKGRFEEIYRDENIRVVVDFAHTEDGLKKALSTLRPFTKGRLIVVFGVYAPAGKEGREKRLGMGEVAAKYADFSVVTSDNPKHLDPHLIVQEISEALDKHQADYKVIIDREEAIQYALNISRKDDVILLAGKGHETSQIIGNEEIPFNEKEIVRSYMAKRRVALGSAN